MKGDKTLLFLIFLLTSAGILILTSASGIIAQKNFGDSFYYVKHQLFYGVLVGFIVGFVFYKLPFRIFKSLSLVIFFVAFFLTILVFVPELGFGYGGAKRWLKIGFLVFQPSELIKLGLIFYLASFFEKNANEIKNFSNGFLPFILIIGAATLPVILEPDIGSALVIGATGIFMYFMAGMRFSHFLVITIICVLTVILLIVIAPYRLQRIETFLAPDKDILGAGYQINQALIAIGSGGLFGVGFGHSQQKYFYIPEVIGDSIFSVFAEELGFIGVVIFIGLYIFFLIKCLKIILRVPNKYMKLVGTGIVSILAIQFFLNIAAISSLLPLTGITLPFVSYGSSSLVVVLLESALLLNISKYQEK